MGDFLTEAQRFWAKVDRNGDCWEWQGARSGRGAGLFYFRGRLVPATRAGWEIVYGFPPDASLMLRHACDNPPCVRPSHLDEGTHLDNMRDRNERGRQARGDRNGQSKLTWPDVAAIRELYAAGGVRQADLAAAFGVSQSTIRDVVGRRLWVN